MPFAAAAFEVLEEGPVRLLLSAAGAPRVVVETLGTLGEPARVLVDGSVVETFAAGVAATTRAYPTGGAGWLVEAADDVVRIFRLGRRP